jgi:hypothetical protein
MPITPLTRPASRNVPPIRIHRFMGRKLEPAEAGHNAEVAAIAFGLAEG